MSLAPGATSQIPTSGERDATELGETLQRLRAEVVADAGEIYAAWRPLIKRQRFAPSALNLARYVALRRHELRELQLELMPWGLSSLGRCEARVIENLDAVIAALDRITAPTQEPPERPS